MAAGAIEEKGKFLHAVDDTPDREDAVFPHIGHDIEVLNPILLYTVGNAGIPHMEFESGPSPSKEERDYDAWCEDQAKEADRRYLQEHGEYRPGPNDKYLEDSYLMVSTLRAVNKYIFQHSKHNQILFRYKNAKDKSKVPKPWFSEQYVPWRDMDARLDGLRTYFIWWGAGGAPLLNKAQMTEFFSVFESYARRMKHNFHVDLKRETSKLSWEDHVLTPQEQAMVKSPYLPRTENVKKLKPEKPESVPELETCLSE